MNSILVFLKSIGQNYSWHNNQVGERILYQIHHHIGNYAWLNKYSNVVVESLNHNNSDHYPPLLKVLDEPRGGERPFRFLNTLVQHQKFKEIVLREWELGNTETMEGIWDTFKI